jgi:hypothetical protein
MSYGEIKDLFIIRRYIISHGAKEVFLTYSIRLLTSDFKFIESEKHTVKFEIEWSNDNLVKKKQSFCLRIIISLVNFFSLY